MKILKNTLLCFTLLLATLIGHAQSPQGQYGNEWYASDPGRTFIPIKVWEDGVYRVHADDLSAAGYDLSIVNTDFLQLYFRGAEQPIYVQETNGSIAYIEFVGLRNDGQVDALMYRDPISGLPDPSLQPQPQISLYSDTATYYLTWSNQLGLRISSQFADNYQNYPAETSFPFQQRLEYLPSNTQHNYVRGGGDAYDVFFTLNSDYVTGEGYTGPIFSYQNPLQFQIALIAPDTQLQTIEYRSRVFGRSNTPHHYQFSDGDGVLWDTILNTSQVLMEEYRYSRTQILPPVLDLSFEALRSPLDYNHFCGLSLIYDRLPTLVGERSVVISRWDQNAVARFDLGQVDGNDTLYAWDLKQGIRSKGLLNNGQGQILIPLSDSSQNVRLVSDLGLRSPLIESIHNLHNICAPDSGAQFVIISHRKLESSAEAYALYRDTTTVEPLSAKVIYIDQIYDEFGYGSTTPLAIKRFVNCALANWNVKPEYILLWGKGGYLTRNEPWNLVPYYGYPVSDGEYVRDLSALAEVNFRLPIGRVNAQTNSDGFAYLDKVDAFEHQPPSAWQQRGLFLRGGISAGEKSAINATMNNVKDNFQNAPMYGIGLDYEPDPNDTLPTPITDSTFWAWMNEGVGVLHYLGHSTSNLFQIDLGEPEDYQNFGRPIATFTYGNFILSPEDSLPSLLERWILTPQRGAIINLGNSGAGYLNPLRDFMEIKSKELYNKTPNGRIGEIIRKSLNLYTDSLVGIQYRNHARYMILQGDPALRLFQTNLAPIDSVWPGDVNYDGVADMGDLLQLGLAYHDSGYARLNPSNQWEAQFSLPWDDAFSNGLNKKHADCNGDGQVSDADTLAISLNYGSLHQKKEDNNFVASGVPLTLLIPQVINPGDTAVIQVFVADSLSPVALYGLRFKVGYDTAMVASGQLWVDFSNSWMGAEGSEILGMYKARRWEGEIEVGITRLNQQAKFGGGKAADINIVISDDIAKKDWSLSSLIFTQGFANDETGDEIPLNALAAWNNELPPIEPLYNRIFPNPVKDQICIERSTHILEDFALWDLQARQIIKWSKEEVAIGCLPVRDLQSGFYLLSYREDGIRRTQKIMIID